MLVGTFSTGGYTYSLRGYDFGFSVELYLTASTTKAKLHIDKGIFAGDQQYLPRWEDLYVSVGSSKVSVSKYFEVENDTNYYNEVNVSAIKKLGEIIAGMRAGCSKSNRADMDLYDTEFTPTKIITYNYEGLGYIKLEMQTIREISYKDNEVSLFLEEDWSYSEKVYNPAPLKRVVKLDLSYFVKPAEDFDWEMDEDEIYSISEIIERNPDKNYLWLNDRKYTVVKEIKEVERICKIIWKHDGIVAFDTETTGLTVNLTSRRGTGDRLVGMVFSIKSGEAWYFPVAHKKVQNLCDVSLKSTLLTRVETAIVHIFSPHTMLIIITIAHFQY